MGKLAPLSREQRRTLARLRPFLTERGRRSVCGSGRPPSTSSPTRTSSWHVPGRVPRAFPSLASAIW